MQVLTSNLIERKGGRPTFAVKCVVVSDDTYHLNLTGKQDKMQLNLLVEAYEQQVLVNVALAVRTNAPQNTHEHVR